MLLFLMLYYCNPYIPIFLVFGLFLCLMIAIPLSWIICRQAAFSDARLRFQLRMDQGHVIRTPWYDLYLPHSDHTTSLSKTAEVVNSSNIKSTASIENKSVFQEKQQQQQVLVFIPGALVEHMAYVGVSSRLADQHGIIVAVINLEPVRLTWGRTSESRMIWLRRDIEQRLVEMRRLKSATVVNNSSNDSSLVWNIGGHSLGGLAAKSLFETSVNLRLCQWRKLIVLGAGIRISKDHHNNPPTLICNPQNTLLIRGTEDGFLHYYHSETTINETKSSISSSSSSRQCQPNNFYSMVSISGGNHAGVAHYGPQVFPIRDGIRLISLDQQQEQTANAMATFLHTSS